MTTKEITVSCLQNIDCENGCDDGYFYEEDDSGEEIETECDVCLGNGTQECSGELTVIVEYPDDVPPDELTKDQLTISPRYTCPECDEDLSREILDELQSILEEE